MNKERTVLPGLSFSSDVVIQDEKEWHGVIVDIELSINQCIDI